MLKMRVERVGMGGSLVAKGRGVLNDNDPNATSGVPTVVVTLSVAHMSSDCLFLGQAEQAVFRQFVPIQGSGQKVSTQPRGRGDISGTQCDLSIAV